MHDLGVVRIICAVSIIKMVRDSEFFLPFSHRVLKSGKFKVCNGKLILQSRRRLPSYWNSIELILQSVPFTPAWVTKIE